MSALSASLKAAEKKLVQVDETNSQGISLAERRMSSRVQAVANAQGAAHEEVIQCGVHYSHVPCVPWCPGQQ